jgi:hypothetical protein
LGIKKADEGSSQERKKKKTLHKKKKKTLHNFAEKKGSSQLCRKKSYFVVKKSLKTWRLFVNGFRTGLPDFFVENDTKTGKNVPNEHEMHGYKISQMSLKYSKWP